MKVVPAPKYVDDCSDDFGEVDGVNAGSFDAVEGGRIDFRNDSNRCCFNCCKAKFKCSELLDGFGNPLGQRWALQGSTGAELCSEVSEILDNVNALAYVAPPSLFEPFACYLLQAKL